MKRREGKSVHLSKGEIGSETTYFEDFIDVLKDWARFGAKIIQIIALDAATGIETNKDLIKHLIEMCGNGVSIQVVISCIT